MSREKQIKEIKNVLIHTCKRIRTREDDIMQDQYAKSLYNAGYRKQSEVIRCKDCEHSYQVGDVRICRHWNYHSTKDDAYCSYAKMKGGAE